MSGFLSGRDPGDEDPPKVLMPPAVSPRQIPREPNGHVLRQRAALLDWARGCWAEIQILLGSAR